MHIPVQLWSQFEAVVSNEGTCQSILLEGLKNVWNTESSQEELVWATIARFGLEEELQASGFDDIFKMVPFPTFRSLTSLKKY